MHPILGAFILDEREVHLYAVISYLRYEHSPKIELLSILDATNGRTDS